MSVTGTAAVRDGIYQPWHTPWRGGPQGKDPVGTLVVDGGVVGDASGGSVTVAIEMRRTEFGFRVLWVPTQITARDNATAENVNLAFVSNGNKRIATDLVEALVMVLGASSTNSGRGTLSALPIEGSSEADSQRVLSAVWDTNADTKTYHLHAFGPVFDMEQIAREGAISEFLSGVR